jgi:membrane associated rhomboid family serine protease
VVCIRVPIVPEIRNNVPTGGLASVIVSIVGAGVLANDWSAHSTMGASGAVMGTTAFFATVFPRATFLIFGIVPCPAWLCVGGLFLYDAAQTYQRVS